MYLPDQVITVSEAQKRTLTKRLRRNPERVSVIHPGIDVSSFYRPDMRTQCRQALGFRPDDFVATYVGRFARGKGLTILLRAGRQILDRCPEVRFLLVGDGPSKASIIRLADELGITPWVRFIGFRRDIPNILSASDIFVLPSLTEGYPISLLEAMAAGKAVVATSVGGIPELVVPDKTGFLVPARNHMAIADLIVFLFTHPAERERVGIQARIHASKEFGTQKMVDAYRVLYESYLPKYRKPVNF